MGQELGDRFFSAPLHCWGKEPNIKFNGCFFPAEFAASDPWHDVAIGRVKAKLPGVEYIDAKIGDSVTLGGSEYNIEAMAVVMRSNGRLYKDMFNINVNSMPGMSGAPLFIDEKYAGFLMAANDRFACCVPSKYVRRLEEFI